MKNRLLVQWILAAIAILAAVSVASRASEMHSSTGETDKVAVDPIAKSSPADSAISRAPTSDYYFFPYRACLLLTLQDVHVEDDPKKWYVGSLVAKVKIEEVLRGKFKKGDTVVLAMENTVNQIFPGKKPDELVGSRCVLAFNPYSPWEGIQSIADVDVPFPGQDFTDDDVQKLKAKLQPASFTDYNCLTVSGVKVSSEKGSEHRLEVTAHVDEILLNDLSSNLEDFDRQMIQDDVADEQKPLKKDFVDQHTQTFVLYNPDPGFLPAAKPDGLLDSSQCVWSFNDYRFEEGKCYLYRPNTPFPGQRFNSADLEQLKPKLAAAASRHAELKADLQHYLEDRWTVDRIKDYCRPELRMASIEQNLVLNSSVVLHGQLHPEAKSEIGDASWYCLVDNEVPNAYSVNVGRKTKTSGLKRSDCWNLEISHPTKSRSTDDDLLIHRLSQTLSRCSQNYYLVHRGQRGPRTSFDQLDRRGTDSPQLIRNQERKITAFSYPLKSGRRLTAQLDERLSITAILIDGKRDADWNQALAEAAANIDKLNERFESETNTRN